jgi:hypothetical protein
VRVFLAAFPNSPHFFINNINRVLIELKQLLPGKYHYFKITSACFDANCKSRRCFLSSQKVFVIQSAHGDDIEFLVVKIDVSMSAILFEVSSCYKHD